MTPQEAIRKLVDAGWTEASLAKAVGVSQPTIHRIKHGVQRRGASFETCSALIRLAQDIDGPQERHRTPAAPKGSEAAEAAPTLSIDEAA